MTALARELLLCARLALRHFIVELPQRLDELTEKLREMERRL